VKRARAEKQENKLFCFEKKKQKTFINLSKVAAMASRLNNKSFLVHFFSKQRLLLTADNETNERGNMELPLEPAQLIQAFRRWDQQIGSIVAAWFPDSERGTAAAIFNSAQYFATVLFAPLMGWIAHAFGSSYVFYVMGGMPSKNRSRPGCSTWPTGWRPSKILAGAASSRPPPAWQPLSLP
jgi:hypothetical protein